MPETHPQLTERARRILADLGYSPGDISQHRVAAVIPDGIRLPDHRAVSEQ